MTAGAGNLLPRGLRLRQRRRRRWWPVVAVAAAGVVLGAFASGATALAVLGPAAILAAAGAAVFRPALGLAILACTFPFDLTARAGPVKLTTSAALLVILVLVWVVRELVLGSPPLWKVTKLDLPVLLFAAATIVSLAGLGGDLQQQLVGLLKAAGGFLVFFIATQSLRSRGDVVLLFLAIVAGGFIQSTGITMDVLTGSQAVSEMTRSTGTEIQANLFAGYLVLVVPLVLALGVTTANRAGFAAAGVVALVLVVALIATLSRSGWLGALTAWACLFWLLPDMRWRLGAVAAAGLAVLVLGGLTTAVGARLAPHTTGPMEMLASRWGVWTTSLAIIVQHPIFGVGVENFGTYYQDYSGGSSGINQAHNIFLNMAAERGLVGLAAFVCLLVAIFRTLGRSLSATVSPADSGLCAGLIAVFAGFLVHSMFDVSYYDYKVLLLFWLLVGAAASCEPLMAGPESRRVPAWPRRSTRSGTAG